MALLRWISRTSPTGNPCSNAVSPINELFNIPVISNNPFVIIKRLHLKAEFYQDSTVSYWLINPVCYFQFNGIQNWDSDDSLNGLDSGYDFATTRELDFVCQRDTNGNLTLLLGCYPNDVALKTGVPLAADNLVYFTFSVGYVPFNNE